MPLLGRPDRHAIWTGDHWIHLDGPVPWASHLAGAVLAGACYGGCPETRCLGWDIDEHEAGADAAAATLALLDLLRGMGIRFPFVTTSKSGRGVHVRVLLDRPWSCDSARAFAVWIRARVNRPAEMCAVIPAGSRTEKGSGAVFGLPFSANRAVREGGGILLDPETLAPVPTSEALSLLPEWPLVDPSELPAAPPLPARELDESEPTEPAPESVLKCLRGYVDRIPAGDGNTWQVALACKGCRLNLEQRIAEITRWDAEKWPQPWNPASIRHKAVEVAHASACWGWLLDQWALKDSLGDGGFAAARFGAAEPRVEPTWNYIDASHVRDTPAKSSAVKLALKSLAKSETLAGPTIPAEQVMRTAKEACAALVAKHGPLHVDHTLELFARCADERLDLPAIRSELEALGKRAAFRLVQGGGSPASAAQAPDSPGRGLVLQHEDTYWLRLPSGDYSRGSGLSAFRARLNEVYGGLELDGEEIRARVHVAEQVVRDYTVDRVTWDLGSRTVSEGLPIDSSLTPGRDPEVEAWLSALVGADRLRDLEQQIATCHPRWLGAPSHATVIVGPPSVGKTLVACGLARIWGEVPPVDLGAVVAQFNGPIGSCPIWLADEIIPPELTGEAYRTLVQRRTHRIELKGREKFLLRGCGRIILAVNSMPRLEGSKTPDDLDAIDARMVTFRCVNAAAAQDALTPLYLADGSTVDLARLARHFRWIQETVQPEPGRFIGAPVREEARQASLEAELDQAPEVWDLVREYLEAPEAYESGYYSEIPPDKRIPVRGRPSVGDGRKCWPFLRVDGSPAVYPTRLAVILGWELTRVVEALRPGLGARVTVRMPWGLWNGYLLTGRAIKCLKA